MMSITCTRRIQFCAGHRVLKHESKCANAHGHNYVALVTARGSVDALDRIGRVVDFSVLKDRIGGWIDKNWDHGFLAFKDDYQMIDALAQIQGQKMFIMSTNPTAENMAKLLMEVSNSQLLGGTGVSLIKVEIWETENCKAEYSLKNE
jgi:6-pyruvoyltetrahydropterin/6-carboxytetrahydropterin synthase